MLNSLLFRPLIYIWVLSVKLYYYQLTISSSPPPSITAGVKCIQILPKSTERKLNNQKQYKISGMLHTRVMDRDWLLFLLLFFISKTLRLFFSSLLFFFWLLNNRALFIKDQDAVEFVVKVDYTSDQFLSRKKAKAVAIFVLFLFGCLKVCF